MVVRIDYQNYYYLLLSFSYETKINCVKLLSVFIIFHDNYNTLEYILNVI